MVGVSTPGGRLTFANRALCDLLQTTRDALQERSWTSCCHPDDAPGVRDAWLSGSSGGKPFTICCRSVEPTRWVELRLSPLLAAGGIERWHGLIVDVDERIQTQQSEREMRLFVESMPALLWRATPEGNADYINEAVSDYTGQPLEDFVNFRWLSMIHEDDVECAAEAWRNSLRDGRDYDDIHRKRGADGVYRWFQQRGRPVRDAQGRIVRWYGLSIDVDERKKMEETIKQMQAQLARTSQMLAAAQLAAAIAHEVNQPLGAMTASASACLNALRATPPDLELAQGSVERAIRHGHAASEVVERIRALFQQAPPQMLDLDVNALMRDVHNMMAEEIHACRASLAIELDPDLPLVQADRVQIQQLLANLIRNGIEAMSAVSDRPREVRICTKLDPAQNEIVIEVRDRGHGLADVRSLFEPFCTTKARGTGLGLAICNAIVEAHNGRIWARPNQPYGAIFAFALPGRYR